MCVGGFVGVGWGWVGWVGGGGEGGRGPVWSWGRGCRARPGRRCARWPSPPRPLRPCPPWKVARAHRHGRDAYQHARARAHTPHALTREADGRYEGMVSLDASPRCWRRAPPSVGLQGAIAHHPFAISSSRDPPGTHQGSLVYNNWPRHSFTRSSRGPPGTQQRSELPAAGNRKTSFKQL